MAATPEDQTPEQAAKALNDEEKKRLDRLENLSRAIVHKKVSQDKETGEIKMDMSPGELKDYITLEENLMKLKRKINGYLPW